MEREVVLLRDGSAVWQGRIVVTGVTAPASAQDYFTKAWQTALAAGAVQADDAGRVQFRFGAR
jgi:hypothetical protein